jgi:2-polyprenyl-3-methyl-5-hydroxy-6-metoxy-1,4-benzoquinol methylase
MLHHLVDPRPILENMSAALRPDGLAIFYEPLQAGYFMVRQAMLQIFRENEFHTLLPD